MTARILLLLTTLLAAAQAAPKIPFLSKKEYTPLILFTLPRGESVHCDKMDKTVKKLEKQLNVRVERMDVARDSTAERLYSMLSQRLPPLLYHRESKQMIQLKINASEEDPNPYIDERRVRSLLKGRRLQPEQKTKGGGSPLMFDLEEGGIDQEDLMDAGLTERQKLGRNNIKERTKTKQSQRK